MPNRPLWDENDQWLPPNDMMDVPMPYGAPSAPPGFRTPPFVAPSQAPTPAPRPAFDALAASVGQQPLRSDPALQPSKTRRILGGLAGAALGAGAGFVNASGRARVDPSGGAALSDSIVNAKFNKANRDFTDKQGVLKAQADIEQARLNDARKQAESTARIGSEAAQEAAARATQARAMRTDTPKPMEHDPSKDLVTPEGKVLLKGSPKADAPAQTPFQAITRIRNSNLNPEEKEAAVTQVIADHNATNPTRPMSPTAATLAVAAAKGDAEAEKALKMLGTYNDKPKASGGASAPSGASTQDQATVDSIIHGTTSLKDVPIKRREYIGGLVDKRRGEMGPNLTAGQKNDLMQADTTGQLIDQVLAMQPGGLEGVGPVAGRVGAAWSAMTGGGSQEGKDVRQLIGNIRGTITKLRAGTALSKTEKQQLDTYVPDITNSEADVISKLNGLKNYLGILKSTTLKYGARDQSSGAVAGPKVGDIRTGPDGKKYRITAIRGDEVDAEPVQ